MYRKEIFYICRKQPWTYNHCQKQLERSGKWLRMYSVIPSKAFLVNHSINENDSPLPPEQCWILKIRHWVGRIVPQCQMIKPISRDKSTLYGERGRQRTKNTEIVLFIPTLLATSSDFVYVDLYDNRLSTQQRRFLALTPATLTA